MTNKILIRTSDRKTLHKDRRSLGMNGENLQEVLLFCLDEKIEGNGIVEVELPDGTKGMIEVDRTEEGYELPVKSSLLTQTGFVKFQLRILHDDVEIFKSEIIALEVKDSINATETIPEQYPTWIDNLTTLKQELEKAESERVSNENKRQSAEKTRQENFTKMQETVSNAVSNIKDLTEEYNSNAKKETKKFNGNAVEQTKTFNDNSDSKLVEYNKNHTDKMKEYDDNSKAKLDAYNKNNTDKTNAYNDNTVLKEKAYNDNAADKVKEYNTNVEQKETELEKLAEKKINEYNQVSAELTAKVEQVQTENEALKAENKLIKEQIPSATASGNKIHLEDSSNLEMNWKIKGGHRQETREGYNLINTNKDIIKSVNSGVTWNGNSYVVNGLTVTWEFDKNDLLLSVHIKGTATEGTNIHIDKRVRTYSAGTYTIYQDGMFVENIGWFRNDTSVSTRTFDEEWTTTVNSIYIPLGETIDRTYTPMLLKGTYTVDNIPTYEQYGASPSPDYLSETETVGNNVNELDIQNIMVGGLTNGNIVSNTISRLVTKEPIPVKSSTTYNINFNELGEFKGARIGIHSLDSEGNFLKDSGWLNFSDTKQIIYTTAENCKSIKIVFSFSKTSQTVTSNTEYTEKVVLYDFYNMKFKLEKGTVATPWSPYGMGSVKIDIANNDSTKSQTAIMPIQQKMLTGDYIKDVEHHEWKKLVFTGEEENWSNPQNTLFNLDKIKEKSSDDRSTINLICNQYRAIGIYQSNAEFLVNAENFEYACGLHPNQVGLRIKDIRFTNLEDFKAMLKSKYDEGNPVIVYYKLATPVDLELTSEQKAVRDTKLYTYKNITNIAVSDELASIDVEYKKDPTTEHDDLQNQIDEIKQLLSTTQTSALLLDNLQKDVESEVE